VNRLLISNTSCLLPDKGGRKATTKPWRSVNHKVLVDLNLRFPHFPTCAPPFEQWYV